MHGTRDPLLAALNLYHRPPFGPQHPTHPPKENSSPPSISGTDPSGTEERKETAG